MLRKLRNFAPFHIRKRLVETLVLSKLDYCNVVFSAMPDYQLKRLHAEGAEHVRRLRTVEVCHSSGSERTQMVPHKRTLRI